MLLRSQDSTKIVNLNNVQGLGIEQPSSPGPWFVCAGGTKMGEYSSKLKALNVLDKIANTWRQYGMEQKTIYMPDDEDADK